MSEELYLNVDHLVEFLAVARDWLEAQSRSPERWTPEAHEDLVAAATRLFASPEPAPHVPPELVAALRAWQDEDRKRSSLSEAERQLYALSRFWMTPSPDPPRCAVPGCGATEQVTGVHVLTRAHSVALAVCPAHRAWLLRWTR